MRVRFFKQGKGENSLTELKDMVSTYSLHHQILMLICEKGDTYREELCSSFENWFGNYSNNLKEEHGTNETEPEKVYSDHFPELFQTEDNSFADQFLPDNSKERLDFNTFPTLLYIVSGRVFEFPGNLADVSKLESWIQSFNNNLPFTLTSKNFNQLVDNLPAEKKVLLLIYDTSKTQYPPCGDDTDRAWWNNLARSLVDFSDIQVVDTDLAEGKEEDEEDAETRMEVQSRLPLNMAENCPQIVVIQGDKYRVYPVEEDILNRKETKQIRRFARKSSINASNQDWYRVRRPLTDIEKYYFTEESKIDRQRKKPNFIMIGATGGLGVIVLAISIFWGLKTSDVVID